MNHPFDPTNRAHCNDLQSCTPPPTGVTFQALQALKRIVLIMVAVLLAALTAQAQDRNQTMNIVFPSGAFHQNGGPVINIKNTTLFSPNAVGDGVTDDTAAFIAMFNYLADRMGRTNSWSNKTDHKLTIYLPSGTYLVSDRLIHSGSVTDGFNFLRLVGQNRNNTIIKLKNNSPGFGPGAKKEVLCFTKYWEGYNGGSKWGNVLRNITIDTGTGNPGAVGVSFFAANAGSIDNVTVRSGDGAGYAGIYFPGWSVQGHFTDITVDGFNEAIRTEVVIENNPIFEHITIRNQLVAGLSLGRAAACVRKLHSTNTVPAVTVWGDGAHTVLLDSQLTGGSAGNPAIRLVDSSKQQLFVRNVSVSGYGTSIQRDGSSASNAAHIAEWRSGPAFRSDSSTPELSMNLPVQDFPLKVRDSNLSQWVSPEDFPGASDAEKIQAALNSGKPNIYFPRYYFTPQSTVLTVPASVKHLDFMHQESWLWGGMRIDQASSDPLYIEGSGRKILVVSNSPRTVAVRNGSLHYHVQTTQPVIAHFSNVATLANGHTDQFCPPNATIYARNINEESWSNTNFVVNGGKLWVLGFKTESDHTAFRVKNGGFLEVLGGYVNFAGQHTTQRPDVLNDNSNVSYIGTNFMFRTHWEGIHEIRNGVLTKFLNGVFPPRITGHSNNYFVPLYVGYDPAAVAAAGGGHGSGMQTGSITREYWTGISGTAVGNLTSHPNFPGSPTGTDTLNSLRAVNWSNSTQTSNWADNYGQRIRGYIVAPQSGNYTFWISGDDSCELWLSTGENPAQKQRIAHTTSWTSPLEWNKYSSQKSVPISLTAGQAYYVEVLHKEGGGGDNLAVGWLKPGQSGTVPSEVIPGSVLAPFGTTPGGPGDPGDPGDLGSIIYENFNSGSAVNNQTTLESVFLLNEVSGLKWNYHGTAGVSGSGAVIAPGGQETSMVHRTPINGFNTNPSIGLSLDALMMSSGEPTFGINWSAFIKNTLGAGVGGLDVRLSYIPPASRTVAEPEKFRVLANGVKIGTPTLPNNTWVGWDIVWTKNGAGTFDVKVDLYNLGSGGTGTPTLIGSYTRNGISNSTMASATQVYAGVHGRSRDNIGVSRIDHFTVAVPAAGGAFAQAFSETYNSGSAVTNQTTLESVFLLNETSGLKWTYHGSAGVSGSGTAHAPGGQETSMVHRTAIPGFATKSAVAVNMDAFMMSSGEPTFGINWSAFIKNTLGAGVGGLDVRLSYIPPASRTAAEPEKFRVLANGVKIGTPTLPHGTWVGWDIVWTKNAAGTFDVKVDLYNLGSGGTGTPTLIGSYTRNGISNSTMASATQVYAGVHGRARDNIGVYRVDNISAGTQ